MILLVVLACGTKGDALTDDDLWTRIEGYSSWDQAEPWAGIQPSSDGTHGAYVQIWLNEAAMASVGLDEAAEDSILVKEGYDDAEGASPRGNLTVMWKTLDVELPETGWYWANFTLEGEVNTSGEPGACTGCHSSGSDWRRMETDTPGGG